LVRNARDLRQHSIQDSTLLSYRSQARGYVYFFLDRKDSGERILVKTDQIALDVYWRAPDLTRQRIIGLRDEKSLPTNIRYHLDHLMVVQDDFGDRIRIGDGDEVESVMHPVAPGAEGFYDYILTDSLTVSMQAGADTVRVYELRVRPKEFDLPAFIGSVFLDRDTYAIVRMDFTFTPASYVDSYLDHIQVSLENGLWLGRHWLPYRQQLEIRREVPYLDFPAGSVIRGWFEVGDYELNPPIPAYFFQGSRVTTVPDSVRRNFPFEQGLHAQLEEEGMEGFRPPPTMDEIRAMAVSMARDRYLSGGGRVRLFLPSPTASSVLRFNRTEGFFTGLGVSYRIRPALGFGFHAGYAFGRRRPSMAAFLTGGERHPEAGAELYLNRPLELGPFRAASGVVNSLSAATGFQDFADIFFASGGTIRLPLVRRNGLRVDLSGRVEDHSSGRNVLSSRAPLSNPRPVLPVRDGTWTSIGLEGSTTTSVPMLGLKAGVLGGSMSGEAFGEVRLGAEYRNRLETRGADFSGSLGGGVLLGNAPPQSHYLLGGRGTVPGYSFRSRAGDRFWLLRAEASIPLLPPFVRLRALGAAGNTWTGGDPLSAPWPQSPASVMVSGGVGLGLAWDVLHLDLARGLRKGGEWELIIAANQSFWPWL